MKQLLFVLSLATALLFTQNTQAQERGKETPPPKGSVKISESPQLQSKINNGRAGMPGKAEAPKTPQIALNKGEQQHIVRAYRIDYKPNPMSNADYHIASILLYDAEDAQIGTINFYGTGSKALATKETVSDKGIVTLAYPFELMDKIAESISRSQQSVIVYNTETKTAYLTMGVMPTRAR